jgi:hypothetical protein
MHFLQVVVRGEKYTIISFFSMLLTEVMKKRSEEELSLSLSYKSDTTQGQWLQKPKFPINQVCSQVHINIYVESLTTRQCIYNVNQI